MADMRGNRVGGNWLMKWDEVKKIPLYSHRLTHQKRMTSELHDSYFRSMTITQAIPKKAEVTYPDRQTSEEIAETWRRVHITAWEFEGNIRPTNWTEASRQVRWASSIVGEELTSCSKESHHPAERTPVLRLSSHGERESHNADGHNFGVKIFQLCSVSSSLSHANLEQPFRTLAIKWKEYIFIKKSSCVFLRASFITASLSLRLFIIASVCIQYIYMYISAWISWWQYNSLTPLQRCNQCILQNQPTGFFWIIW